MRGGVDPARQTADDGEAGIRELVGQFLGRFGSLLGRASRADHAYGFMVARRQLTRHVEDNRRCVNFAKLSGILRRLSRNNLSAELADALKFRRKINYALPTRDLIGDFRTNSFHRTQGRAASGQNPLRSFENLEQLAQPHGSHRRKHVQRDACLCGVHLTSAEKAAQNGARRLEWNLVVVRLGSGTRRWSAGLPRRLRVAAGAPAFFYLSTALPTA
jgi:hypothetical protein